MEFFLEHILEIIFGLVSAGALAFCKHLANQLKDYKKLLAAQNDSESKALVQNEIAPLSQKIDEFKRILQDHEDISMHRIEMILEMYRFELIQSCKRYLRQGYMTQDQYDQLTELYKVYHGLGGNGQAQEYFEKASDLPIHDYKESEK